MGSGTRRKRGWGIGKENQGREVSSHAAGDITGWVLSHVRVSQGPFPVLKPLNITRKAAQHSRFGAALSQLLGDKSSTTGRGTRGSAAAKPTLVFQGCIPAAFRVCIVTCLNTNRIPNVPKLFHALGRVWGEWRWMHFLFFPFVFTYFSSSVTLLRRN